MIWLSFYLLIKDCHLIKYSYESNDKFCIKWVHKDQGKNSGQQHELYFWDLLLGILLLDRFLFLILVIFYLFFSTNSSSLSKFRMLVFFCFNLLSNSLSIAFQNYLIPKAVLHDSYIWVYFYLSIAFHAFSSIGRYTLFSSVRSILLPTIMIFASYGQFVTAYSSHDDTLLCEASFDISYTRTTISASIV